MTQSGAATAGDQILVGNRTYTFVAALTGAKAVSTMTNATSFTDGETMTIDGVTYTFKTTPVKQNDIAIGVSVAVSLDNMKQAINQGDSAYPTAPSNEGSGTTWHADTRRHPTVIATTNGATTQVIQARELGTLANSYITSETAATGSWTSTVMAGGVANVADELKLTGVAETELNLLKDAINNTELLDSNLEGTNYSWGTRPHTQVTATTNGATTQVVAARNAAFDNASIATTDPVDTGTVFSWGATTLASGVRGVAAANTTTWAGSAGVSGDKNVI